jgi:hypothetical protein|tara:strand:+ start:1464 stop:1622 length:159 start_codon:yes stop_codon:yes gene_type:complete
MEAVEMIASLWAPLAGITLLIYTISRIIGDVEVLKEKVKVLFDLFNQKDKDK